MKKNKKPLIIGNWKTNPATLERAKSRFQSIRRSALEHPNIDVVVCPPFPYISALSGLVNTPNLAVGAQDVSVYGEGAKTGEVSASMVESAGAKYVIIGHSERRAMGETDAIVSTKIGQALKTGMQVIICIGETKRDNEGAYLEVVKSQLKEALAQVERQHFNQILIAYEPVWAISSNKDAVVMTPYDIHQMVLYIKKLLTEWWSDTIAMMVPIIYGGSVAAENAQDILWNGEVDGALVGRASWEVETFRPIFDAVNFQKKPVIVLTKKKPREDARKEAQVKAKKISSKKRAIVKKAAQIVKKASKKKTKPTKKKKVSQKSKGTKKAKR